MASATLRRKSRYWFDNTMAKGTPALVALLALASLTIVVIGASLMVLFDPRPAEGPDRGLIDSLWQSVLRALDPGTVAGDTGHWWYIAISFIVTIGGILVVTAFIGVLTIGLDAKLAELRKGRSTVLETNHTVLLGWSDQMFTVISELVEANSNQRCPCIAILADQDKVEMEDAIQAKVGKTRGPKVVIYLKPVELYVRIGQTINFQAVVEAVRLRRESAIGYRIGAKLHEWPAFGIVLNPDKREPVAFRPS